MAYSTKEAKPPTHHVLISGPGRVGATLLMKTLTDLGLNTGYSRKDGLHHTDGCRYEWPLRGSRMKFPFPYILKEPQMCADIDLRIEALKLEVDHIYIMLRRPGPVAPALDFMGKGKRLGWEERLNYKNLDKAERGFSRRILQLTHLVAEMDLPHTLVSFPRWAEDYKYGYKKFQFLLKDISLYEWTKALEANVDKKLLAKVKADMPEWFRAYMREWIT